MLAPQTPTQIPRSWASCECWRQSVTRHFCPQHVLSVGTLPVHVLIARRPFWPDVLLLRATVASSHRPNGRGRVPRRLFARLCVSSATLALTHLCWGTRQDMNGRAIGEHRLELWSMMIGLGTLEGRDLRRTTDATDVSGIRRGA